MVQRGSLLLVCMLLLGIACKGVALKAVHCRAAMGGRKAAHEHSSVCSEGEGGV
jgi:hypothetical protein